MSTLKQILIALILTVPLPGQSQPVITGVVNGASFQPGVASGSWVTITGSNLSSVTATWEKAIVDGRLPTTLEGVSVSLGGKPGYIYYVSPSQINLQAPDLDPGVVTVVVTTPTGTGTVTTTAAQTAPAMFLWAGKYVVATRQDYSLAVKNGTFTGNTTVPAKPGDVIVLWGTGFGPTKPVVPAGIPVPSDKLYPTASDVTVTVNNIPALVYGSALSPESAGLYQVAIQIPTSAADGDWPIQATIGGVKSPASALITVQQQIKGASCSFPLVSIQTGSDASCKGGNTHMYPVGMPGASCHGWRAVDTSGRQHDNSANSIVCNGDGTFSFVQFAGNLTCSGNGQPKTYRPNTCAQDIPPTLFSIPTNLACCSAPTSTACKTGIPEVGVAGASIFLNSLLCVP